MAHYKKRRAWSRNRCRCKVWKIPGERGSRVKRLPASQRRKVQEAA